MLQGRLCGTVPQQLHVKMGVGVNKAWGDHQSGGVEHLPPAVLQIFSNSQNFAVLDADIAQDGFASDPINDHPVLDQNVEHSNPL